MQDTATTKIHRILQERTYPASGQRSVEELGILDIEWPQSNNVDAISTSALGITDAWTRGLAKEDCPLPILPNSVLVHSLCWLA